MNGMKLGPKERLENLRRLAEKSTGIRPTAAAMIEALVGQITASLKVTPAMVQHLAHEQAQQDLINSCVRWAMRTMGPHAPYGQAYQVYCERVQGLNIEPLSLKTFKNRALNVYGEDVTLPASNLSPSQSTSVAMAQVFSLEAAE
jgi:hypothetical protein